MKYVVSATLTKDIPTGLNIMCCSRGYLAESKEEAVGRFVLEISKEYEEHQIHVRPVCICVDEFDFS